MKKNKISRVDVQVSMMIAGIVIVSFVCVYFFNYTVTHQDMIYSLEERSNSIHQYVEDYLDKSTFVNDGIEKDDESYQKMKEKLEDVKAATNVMYLYTARKTENGDYIYLVDGLPEDSDDFRNPGDKIETEIIPEMERALQGEIVMPDQIKKTTWGNIFISYFPIHDHGEIVGVLGIEFNAGHQFRSFQIIRWGTPIIAVIACITAIFIAARLFRRISNPSYKDMANSDYLTNLKNRNAFMVNLENSMGKVGSKQIGMVVADLNDLKKINDEQGHQMGDCYLCEIGNIIQSCAKNDTVYRIGGDEFVIFCEQVNEQGLQTLIRVIEENIVQHNQRNHCDISLSMGYALYDATIDHTLEETFSRADCAMYEQKRKIKKERQAS